MTPDDLDITLRLVAATVVGMIIGSNRDLRGRPAGIRTMGLVCLGSAMVAVTAQHIPALMAYPDALSRVVQGVIQGVMAGIGFLGAGVLIKGTRHTVYGMTTAAAIWVAAALGIAAGLASWTVFGVGAGLTLLLLVVLHPVEEWLEKQAQKRRPPPGQDDDQP
jgi:putative Mg2+ transporter-C (MgtC) family protein